MIYLKNKYGDWAVVVGAAMGLGESFCYSLAKQGINIVLIDKEKDLLNTLSERLATTYHIKTLNIHLDLFKSDSADKIMDTIRDLDCGLLIYCAVFNRIKKFTDYTTEDLDHYLNVNIASQLKLVHAFSKHLINKNHNGGILLMSSLAGLLGMQLIAPYAASKAFIWNLAESLYYELKPQNIDVLSCIAGPISTRTYLNTNPQYGFIRPGVQEPEVVAESALKKLGKKALYIPGCSNRINYFILTRLLPRKMAAAIANRSMRKMYPKA